MDSVRLAISNTHSHLLYLNEESVFPASPAAGLQLECSPLLASFLLAPIKPPAVPYCWASP
jgi:hypothetical protein